MHGFSTICYDILIGWHNKRIMMDLTESTTIGRSMSINKISAETNQFIKCARKMIMILIISFILKSYLLFYNFRMDIDTKKKKCIECSLLKYFCWCRGTPKKNHERDNKK